MPFQNPPHEQAVPFLQRTHEWPPNPKPRSKFVPIALVVLALSSVGAHLLLLRQWGSCAATSREPEILYCKNSRL
jgi:hypothetical protein